MHGFPKEVAAKGRAAGSLPPDEDVLEIGTRAADAILGPAPSEKVEEVSARSAPPLASALLSYGPHAGLAACLFGVACLVGSYFVGPPRTAVKQETFRRAKSGHPAQ